VIEERITLRGLAWCDVTPLAIIRFDYRMRVEVDQRDETETGFFVIEHHPTMNNFAAGFVSCPCASVLVTVEFSVAAIDHRVGYDNAGLAARIEPPCEHQKLFHESIPRVHPVIVARPSARRQPSTPDPVRPGRRRGQKKKPGQLCADRAAHFPQFAEFALIRPRAATQPGQLCSFRAGRRSGAVR
jgi:hypothetical protein